MMSKIYIEMMMKRSVYDYCSTIEIMECTTVVRIIYCTTVNDSTVQSEEEVEEENVKNNVDGDQMMMMML